MSAPEPSADDPGGHSDSDGQSEPDGRARPVERDSRQSDDRPWIRFAGLGMELAGTTLVLAGIGYLIDRQRGAENGLGVAIGALIGFSFGMFRFILVALKEIDKQSK